jgi:hypothetical protein
MSEQRLSDACGEHSEQFDHTCDDCMLEYNHYDPGDNEERTQEDQKPAETV